jgi:hypothetical protein
MKEPQETAQQPHTAIGSKDVEVLLLDGTTAHVRVHELKISQWRKASAIYTEEVEMANLCTMKPKDWVENNVSPRSFGALWAAVVEVNGPFFDHCNRTIQTRLGAMPAGIVERVLKPA